MHFVIKSTLKLPSHIWLTPTSNFDKNASQSLFSNRRRFWRCGRTVKSPLPPVLRSSNVVHICQTISQWYESQAALRIRLFSEKDNKHKAAFSLSSPEHNVRETNLSFSIVSLQKKPEDSISSSSSWKKHHKAWSRKTMKHVDAVPPWSQTQFSSGHLFLMLRSQCSQEDG